MGKVWCSGTPGFSSGLAKGELSVLGWTLGLRGTRSACLLVTEVQEAVPSRLGEAAPHPWSAAPGSPTGQTQGLISCQKNLLSVRDKRSHAAQGRLDLPHLGYPMVWPQQDSAAHSQQVSVGAERQDPPLPVCYSVIFLKTQVETLGSNKIQAFFFFLRVGVSTK